MLVYFAYFTNTIVPSMYLKLIKQYKTIQFLFIVFQSSIGSSDKYYCEESDYKSVSSKLSSERIFYINVDENRVCIKMFYISHFILVL